LRPYFSKPLCIANVCCFIPPLLHYLQLYPNRMRVGEFFRGSLDLLSSHFFAETLSCENNFGCFTDITVTASQVT
jgi:hypothetical protein